jgi:hypothetical protein
VIVLYDGDHDGIEEGVGAGIPVWIGPNWSPTVKLTNAVSAVSFTVEKGAWYVRAEVPSSFPLFVWVCHDFKVVDEPEEFLVLRCRERFFLRFPFLTTEDR